MDVDRWDFKSEILLMHSENVQETTLIRIFHKTLRRLMSDGTKGDYLQDCYMTEPDRNKGLFLIWHDEKENITKI